MDHSFSVTLTLEQLLVIATETRVLDSWFIYPKFQFSSTVHQTFIKNLVLIVPPHVVILYDGMDNKYPSLDIIGHWKYLRFQLNFFFNMARVWVFGDAAVNEELVGQMLCYDSLCEQGGSM